MSTHNDRMIQQEADILYSLSIVIDRLLMDLDRRMISLQDSFQREKKLYFRSIQNGIKQVYNNIEKLRPDIENSAKASNYRDLDVWDSGANEICRLLLLYFEKCDESAENANALMRTLRSMEGKGVIDEEDIARFYMKK